jgi:hypothetical protein
MILYADTHESNIILEHLERKSLGNIKKKNVVKRQICGIIKELSK